MASRLPSAGGFNGWEGRANVKLIASYLDLSAVSLPAMDLPAIVYGNRRTPTPLGPTTWAPQKLDHRLAAAAVIAACGSPEPMPCSDKVSRDGADAVRTAIAAAARGGRKR
eukprot:7390757-Prymnesium_polylepis.1